MVQQNRITKGSVATSIREEHNRITVQYHNTIVVDADLAKGTCKLDNGGWATATTKTRMNQASKQFVLGYSVQQKDFAWYVTDYTGKVYSFERVITIPIPKG